MKECFLFDKSGIFRQLCNFGLLKLHKDSELFDKEVIICSDVNCDVCLNGANSKKVNLLIEKFNESVL